MEDAEGDAEKAAVDTLAKINKIKNRMKTHTDGIKCDILILYISKLR